MNQQQDSAGMSADPLSKSKSFKDEMSASLKDDLSAGKSKMADLAQTAAEAGKAQVDSGISRAAGQVDTLARAVDVAANRLKDENQEGLAAFATHVASSITTLADRLRERSVDDLASDARQLARSNPAMFLAGSVAVGFGLTRFLKASARVSGNEDHARTDSFGSSYGDSRSSGESRYSQEWGGASTFPEMNRAGMQGDGNFGGTSTNTVSGGSHG